jgi:hypothetical protein
MNKKITSSALAALMIAGSTSFSALAAMSNGTVVIGNKAFDLNYANNPKNADEITNAIIAGGSVYVKGFDGVWIDNTTGKTVEASVIPAVVYKSADKEIKFDAADKDVVASTLEVTPVGTKAVQVKFNKAVDTTKVVLKVKKGAAIYGSTVAWNEAKDTATLTTVVNLPAADYTVEASGLTEAVITKAFTVNAEVASKIEVTSTTVALVASPTVTFKVSNQYGEDMKINGTTTGVVVSAYNTTQKKAQSLSNGTADNKLTFNAGFATTGNAELAKLSDVIRVTVAYAGLTAQTNVTVVDQASNATIAFGDIAPLKDKTRISVSETGFVLPYTMFDQFGVASKLPASYGANTDLVADVETIAGVQFVSSNPAVVDVDTFAVDANNKLTFNTGATAGTAVITAVINASGAVASFSVTVNGTGKVDQLVISAPTALVAAKETVKLDLNAVDQFGAVIAGKDISGVVVTSSNTAVVADGSTISAGKLNVVTLAAGTTVLTAKVGTKTVGTVTVVVEAEAKATQVNTISFGPKFELGAKATLTTDDFIVVDQYGRTMDKTKITFTVAEKTPADTQFTVANSKDFTADVVGSSVMVLTAKDANNVTAAAAEFTLEVIASADITSYSITAVPTMYNLASHAKALELVGKTASGATVMLKDNKITHATTSNNAVALVATSNLGVVTVTGASATADGTAVISVWAGTTKLAETTVTVSKVAPVVTTAKFSDTVETALAGTVTLSDNLQVKDQYGVVIPDAGFWTTSDATKATVSGGVVTEGTAVAGDKVTIGYVTSNGIVVTTVLTK